MIDGLIKSKIDPLWEAMATPLVKAGFSPNQVTFAGLVLIVVTSLAYLWHGSPLIYGHPQGPTGTRLIVELIEELALRGGGYGLFSGCAAGDTGMALVLKVG